MVPRLESASARELVVRELGRVSDELKFQLIIAGAAFSIIKSRAPA